MQIEAEFCVVLTTAGNQAEAERLADGLVAQRLAACVQIVEINSRYIWEGNLQKDREYLMLLKTRASAFAQIEAYIRREHTYQVPELILLPVQTGLEAYLGWIRENTGGASG